MNTNLNIQISPLSDMALYEQITEQLKELIFSGTLEDHTPLPSVRGLAQMLGISVITTRRAYTELEQQGYVITIPAKGTFVSYRFRERLKELGILKFEKMLTDLVYLAQALEIDEKTLTEQISSRYAYAQNYDYNPVKARQAISQFIRNS